MKATHSKTISEARLHRSGYILGLFVVLLGLIISGKLFTTPGVAEPLITGVNALPGGLKSFIAHFIPLGQYLQQYYIDMLLIAAGFFLLLRFFLERRRTVAILTSDGLRVEKGVFGTDYREIPFYALQGIQAIQSPAGAIFGRGTLVLHVNTGEVIVLSPVSGPKRFRQRVIDTIEKQRQSGVF